ncbi:unnamed protein product, partial [Ilex paraguariensis]
MLPLSGRANSSEKDTRALQVDLVKSKAPIYGLEDENKSLLDRHGLGYTNESTNISSKIMFVYGITNPSPPQVGTSSKVDNSGKGRHTNRKVLKEAKTNYDLYYTRGEM